MCGIIGMMATKDFTKNDKDFFKEALFIDQLRGKDSTGIFGVDKENPYVVDVFKRAYPAADFLQLVGATDIINNAGNYRCMVGHNRASTKGATNHNNAHPFQFGDITLVHNGTLRNYTKLPGYDHKEVDSRLLCRAVEELGIVETVERITGAYALVWHDASDNTLHFLRNDERPFACSFNADGTFGHFASEKAMLDWMLQRNKLKETPLILEPNQHCTFFLDNETLEPRIEEVKKKNPPIVVGKKGAGGKKAKATGATKRDANLPDEYPRVGDTLEVCFYNTKPYRKSTATNYRGVLEGAMIDDPYCAVEVHGIDCAQYGKEGIYTCEVVSVVWSDLEKDYTVFAKDAVMIEDMSALYPDDTPPSFYEEDDDIPFDKGDTKKVATNVTPIDKNKKVSLRPDAKVDLSGAVDAVNDVEKGVTPEDKILEVVGPTGKMIPVEEYFNLVKFGCACCSCDLAIADADHICWRDSFTPLCISCEVEQDLNRVFEVTNPTTKH